MAKRSASDRARYRARLEQTERPLRPDKRRDRTREELLQAATRVVARDGANATSVAAIAKEAGMTSGTFYNYFDSKDAAVTAVIERAGDQLRAVATAASAEVDPAEGLAVAIRLLFAVLGTEPHLRRFVVTAGLRDPQLRAPFTAGLAGRVHNGVEAGLFRPETVEVGVFSALGVVAAALGAWDSGALTDDPSAEVATQILCIFGVSRRDATRIAQRAVPDQLVASVVDTVLPEEP
jgi:AcrR family transcriptional regulator